MAKTNKISSYKSVKDRSFTGIGNLIKLLPTGTVFIFQFLNPVLTNNGNCNNPTNMYLTSILIGLCGVSCCFSCFTDSYKGNDGKTHYSIATKNGLWPCEDDQGIDLSSYRLRVGDFVHALFSLVVFSVLALLDSNTVGCFYPEFETTGKLLIMVLPPVVGAVSGSVFMLFPNNRHGIGYPLSDDSSSNDDNDD